MAGAGFYKTLLANLDTGVVVHGPDTTIEISNPKAQALLGLSEAEISGKQAMDPEWHFLREDGDRMPLEEYPVNLVMASKKPLRNYVVGIHNTRISEETWVLVNAFPEFDSQEGLTHVVVTFWDITHLKIAEAALAKRTAELTRTNRRLKNEIAERQQVQQALIRKQRQMDRELAYAAKVQQALIPKASPRIPAMRIGWRFDPCQQIGGDIFNYHGYGQNHLSFYMLDVCGHGVAAALIAATVAQFLHPGSDLTGDTMAVPRPENVLNRLEGIFPFERFESFFSIIYLTLDCTQGRLVYSCGGHPPPLILGANGDMRILKNHGPVIGVVGGRPFGQSMIQLKPGDKVFLYSDGLLDYTNDNGAWFGKDRLYKILRRHTQTPIQTLLDEIDSALKDFGNGLAPDDDVTMLLLEYRP